MPHHITLHNIDIDIVINFDFVVVRVDYCLSRIAHVYSSSMAF